MEDEDSIFNIEDSTTNDGIFFGTAIAIPRTNIANTIFFRTTVKVDDILCLLESEREARRLR